MVVAKGCREGAVGSSCSMGRVPVLQNDKILEVGNSNVTIR